MTWTSVNSFSVPVPTLNASFLLTTVLITGTTNLLVNQGRMLKLSQLLSLLLNSQRSWAGLVNLPYTHGHPPSVLPLSWVLVPSSPRGTLPITSLAAVFRLSTRVGFLKHLLPISFLMQTPSEALIAKMKDWAPYTSTQVQGASIHISSFSSPLILHIFSNMSSTSAPGSPGLGHESV